MLLRRPALFAQESVPRRRAGGTAPAPCRTASVCNLAPCYHRAVEKFDPAWWLSNAHLQTIFRRVVRKRSLVATRREYLTTPDGDEVVLDHVDVPGAGRRVLLLHGLEGSSHSVYAQGMLRSLSAAGVSASVLNFRSCAREGDGLRPNRSARLYHSGETTDFDFVARLIAARAPETELCAFGVSLGGNVLLKWLGEHAGENLLKRAVTISAPFDLAAGAEYLDSGLSRFYVRMFLRSLNEKAHRVAGEFPEAKTKIDLDRARTAKTFYEYDDAVTAPLHGFDGAADYYERSSSIRFIDRITVPTLCIVSEDDPFQPPASMHEAARRASPAVCVVITRRGGHVGFISGTPWRPHYWAEEQAVRFLSE